MATFKGKDGVVKVGSNAIGELRSWTLDESAAVAEDTVMGDDWVTNKSIMNSWSGSAEAYLDDGDTNGQVALTIGSEATMSFQFEGDTTGDRTKSGSAIVTAISESGAHDGIVEVSFSFTGNGALTVGTAS